MTAVLAKDYKTLYSSRERKPNGTEFEKIPLWPFEILITDFII
jgi:hypothetical protein